MTAKPKFKSDAFEAIHSSAQALFKVGAIDKATLRNFDESCLVAPSALEPEQIKKLREQNNVSQPVFARFLNTTESTVQKWESGAKRPSGMALKLLEVVRKHGLKVLA
jgi:putative transcriptional regulator